MSEATDKWNDDGTGYTVSRISCPQSSGLQPGDTILNLRFFRTDKPPLDTFTILQTQRGLEVRVYGSAVPFPPCVYFDRRSWQLRWIRWPRFDAFWNGFLVPLALLGGFLVFLVWFCS